MNNVERNYCKVAVKYPGVRSILTYAAPTSFTPRVGQLVEVPLGKRKSSGCIIEIDVEAQSVIDELGEDLFGKIKEVSSLVDEDFCLGANELELYRWMSKYYHYSLGQLIFDCIPKILKKPRKANFEKGSNLPFPYEMNEKQNEIYQDIKSKAFNGFNRFYVHGVTGSGKTLIYLNLIKDTISRGKSVLFLLPEINLTPQFTKNFLEHLSCPVLPYHSGVTNSNKNHIWKTLKSNVGPVVLMGVRSSVFLPIQNLGLVIVDEEHDQSFKQSDRCPYNGRDVATKKAQLSDCSIVLGSATPAVENYFNFKNSSEYYQLTKRAQGGFPKVELIDCRHSDKEGFNSDLWPLEKAAVDEISSALEKGEQVLVFINKLGFAAFIQCRACGYRFQDPNTETNLRYFKSKNILQSSHSDYKIPLPDICPECDNMNLHQKGFGTEKVCEVLQNLFPEKTVERFDRDEIKNLEQLSDKLERFHSGNIDIFVGTQMLSKGHNFERVNTVLILGVDSLLNFADYRAVERTYQTVTQITGRSGRYSPNSKVLIQTLAPENHIFSLIKSHSFEGFYPTELAVREIADLTPYVKMATIYFNCRFRDRVIKVSEENFKNLNHVISKRKLEVQLLGPAPAQVEKKSGQFSWYILLKAKNVNDLHQLLASFEHGYKPVSGISFKIDVDPYHVC